MNQPREGPNPLRPYYIPPSIGLPVEPPANATSSGISGHHGATSNTSFGSSARDMFSDIDYSDYLSDSSPSVSEMIKKVLDQAVWKYTNVLLAQPFEVAKTILQVYVVQDAQEQYPQERRGREGYREDRWTEPESDSENDEPSYFTSDAPLTPTSGSSSRRHITDRNGYIPPASGSSASSPHSLNLKTPHSLLEVLSQLWTSAGPAAVWKGANTTFIYNILLRTLETFTASLLSTILNIPDPSLLISGAPPSTDILNSPSPLTSLLITLTSTALSNLILSPIDTLRTLFILTPSSHAYPPRSLLRAHRLLPSPSFLIPSHLIPITLLTSTLPSALSASTPLILRQYLRIDPILNPSTWSICTFTSSVVELCIRLPMETVLRRAQIATFTNPALAANGKPKQIETVVPTPKTYRAVLGTIWSVVYEEGTSRKPDEAAKMLGKAQDERKTMRKGQGVEGLYRGWRVGMWGLVGVWGTAFMGGFSGGASGAGTGAGGEF